MSRWLAAWRGFSVVVSRAGRTRVAGTTGRGTSGSRRFPAIDRERRWLRALLHPRHTLYMRSEEGRLSVRQRDPTDRRRRLVAASIGQLVARGVSAAVGIDVQRPGWSWDDSAEQMKLG